ncbi:unnamed protein product [Amaranthus hypochondriacus]
MDLELKQAACLGDTEFLHTAFATKSTDYFLSYYSSPDGDHDIMGNIFHLAARKVKLGFMKEAMKILPDEIVVRLLSQQDEDDWNPLHVAASKIECLEPVRLILDFYKSVSYDLVGEAKPWLALNNFKATPLHTVLFNPKKTEDDDACALELLSMDNVESFCNIVDVHGNSPLFYAVRFGFSRVAEIILLSSPSSYSLSGDNGSTPLHFAPNSSENVLRLLLEKHPELLENIDKKSGYNVVHQWAELKQIWAFKYVIKGGFPDASSKIFTDLINSTTEKQSENNPLHIAAKTGIPEIARVLVQGYQKEIQAKNQKSEIVSLNCPPWRGRNMHGETPLISAISSKDEEMALYFLSIDSTLCQIYNNRGESPLLCAIGYGRCGRVVEQILNIQDPLFSDLRSINGTNVLHLVGNCPENIGKRVLEKYWWMMSLLDDKGKNALSCAKELKVPWLIKLLKNPSLIQKEPFDWITACEKNENWENWAVAAFIDSCQDLQKVCREKQDTPLHHIKFQTYEECLKFLKKSPIAELKNSKDFQGKTPLHRVLERKDKHLAKALLIDDAVERNIADNHGTTAMNLLSKLCKQNDEWESLCKEIKINPYLRTTYIQSRTNLEQMRNTLSVVAALLATITFAAGFTLPGGLKQESGYAMLAKKAPFIVFLLADVYAMCTSMLVLFCLIWSMVCDHDMQYVLVDRSVFILMQSLYGTMVAFMTGIYTVINHSTLWVAIVIFVMCSLIGISANRTVLHTILSKFIPSIGDNKDRQNSRKQRTACNPRMDESQKAEGSSSHQNQDHTDDHHLEMLEEGKKSIIGSDFNSKQGK